MPGASDGKMCVGSAGNRNQRNSTSLPPPPPCGEGDKLKNCTDSAFEVPETVHVGKINLFFSMLLQIATIGLNIRKKHGIKYTTVL